MPHTSGGGSVSPSSETSAQSTTIVQSNRSSNAIVWTVVVDERQPLVAARDRIDRVDDGFLALRAQQRREAGHRAGAVAVGAAVARQQDALRVAQLVARALERRRDVGHRRTGSVTRR